MQAQSTFEWASMKILTNPLPNDQGLAFPNPLSTNHIVRAFYTRAQSHLWVVKIVSLQEVYEVLPSGALTLHLVFFLPLSLSFSILIYAVMVPSVFAFQFSIKK